MSTKPAQAWCAERTRIVIEMAMTTSTAAAPASHDCVVQSQARPRRRLVQETLTAMTGVTADASAADGSTTLSCQEVAAAIVSIAGSQARSHVKY